MALNIANIYFICNSGAKLAATTQIASTLAASYVPSMSPSMSPTTAASASSGTAFVVSLIALIPWRLVTDFPAQCCYDEQAKLTELADKVLDFYSKALVHAKANNKDTIPNAIPMELSSFLAKNKKMHEQALKLQALVKDFAEHHCATNLEAAVSSAEQSAQDQGGTITSSI